MSRNPNHMILLTLMSALFFILSGCEKSDYYDDPTETTTQKENTSSGGSKSEEGNTGGSNDGEYDDGGYDDGGYNDEPGQRNDTLTVDEFIAANFEGGAFVEGYIIGDCTKSFKSSELAPPFTHPQAILLADDPYEQDKEHILAVELKKKSARRDLNLVDHPEYYRRRVLIFGYPATYLHMAGLRDIGFYEIK